MEKLKPLQLTKKEIDTSMAMVFLEKYNKFIEWPDHGQFIVMEQRNKISKYTADSNNLLFKISKISVPQQLDPVHTSRNLGKKIEENTEIFVQLEYLARGTDARDVRHGHIMLLSQIVRCGDALWNSSNRTPVFLFNESTPLYVLGTVVAYCLYCRNDKFIAPVILIQHKSLIPLCIFFSEICHDIGFDISLVFVNEADCCDVEVCNLGEAEAGCSGVIAEWSDLDSAIDVFIDSSVTAPWRLKQMYVQESIFEEFKGALEARTREPAESGRLVVGNKAFLVECLVPTATSGHDTVIHVQAYRTTKELLSLLQTPYLSVWAADAAVSNEIALNATAHTVWVNEYGSFEGPPRAALSHVSNLCIPQNAEMVELKEISKTWCKMQTAERLEVIITTIEASNDKELMDLLPDLTLGWRSGDLIHITDKTICLGVQKQMDFISITSTTNKKERLRVLKSLIYGNGVKQYGFDECFINELKKKNVPITRYFLNASYDADSEDLISVKGPILLERLKVIRTNYGTIFAN